MLEKINDVKDLKQLEIDEMEELADEIRGLILKKASVYGGHVGSNLGIVETTIAFHYVFNSPYDKVIFDVSHQCYTHKILTGRKNAFIDEERYAEVSGFTNPDESEHDHFRIGHSATSISLACGMAKARDLLGHHENIVAVIGDAAMGGGEALEGLNYAGSELKSKLIIVLNDNQMSIANNHGGLYTHLAELRDTNGNSENNIFKALGFNYLYVSDGNNIESMINAFNRAKEKTTPTVIHICTTKGKGYAYAEKNKEDWHWRRPFDLKTGELTNPYTGRSYDKILNDYLLEKMKQDKAVVAFAAGVPLTSAFSKDKREIAGNQFVDVGIMEEHAIAMIAGATANGAKAVFTTDCTFYQRVYDQVAQEVCINNIPVTMLVRNASVWGMTDVTHLGIFDIAIFGNIPNLLFLAPTNCQEYMSMVAWSIDQNDFPVMIRIPRYVVDASFEVDLNFDNMKYQVCEQGEKIAIIALGDFFQLGEQTKEYIEERTGENITLINPRYANIIDEELLEKLSTNHSLIITLEDGIIEGGFGEKISSFLAKKENVQVFNYGLKKEFLDRYDVKVVMEDNHLTPELMYNDVKKYI